MEVGSQVFLKFNVERRWEEAVTVGQRFLTSRGPRAYVNSLKLCLFLQRKPEGFDGILSKILTSKKVKSICSRA